MESYCIKVIFTSIHVLTYAHLASTSSINKGNMLQDHIRTSTYQRAMINNATDFYDKIVLDVGTGTGILAFFALQAGAKLVYAVDASDSIFIAKKLAKANGYDESRIVLVQVPSTVFSCVVQTSTRN